MLDLQQDMMRMEIQEVIDEFSQPVDFTVVEYSEALQRISDIMKRY